MVLPKDEPTTEQLDAILNSFDDLHDAAQQALQIMQQQQLTTAQEVWHIPTRNDAGWLLQTKQFTHEQIAKMTGRSLKDLVEIERIQKENAEAVAQLKADILPLWLYIYR